MKISVCHNKELKSSGSNREAQRIRIKDGTERMYLYFREVSPAKEDHGVSKYFLIIMYHISENWGYTPIRAYKFYLWLYFIHEWLS